MNTLKQLFWVSRPVSWPNTAFPFGAAYLVLAESVDWHFIVGSLFFLISYNLLVYGVNDVFDYESDIRNPRKGGIEGAVSAKKLHKPILIACAVTTIPFVIALLFLGTLLSAAILAMVMFFVLAYSVPVLRFKERPFIDSFTSSMHFTGPLLYALSLFDFPSEAWPLVIAFFLWGMASHAFGAVQDIIPDREGGLHSIATVLGAAATVRFAFALYLVSGVLLLRYELPISLTAVIGFVYALNIVAFINLRDEDSESSNVAWRRFIYLNLCAGFLITQLLIYLYVL